MISKKKKENAKLSSCGRFFCFSFFLQFFFVFFFFFDVAIKKNVPGEKFRFLFENCEIFNFSTFVFAIEKKSPGTSPRFFSSGDLSRSRAHSRSRDSTEPARTSANDAIGASDIHMVLWSRKLTLLLSFLLVSVYTSI